MIISLIAALVAAETVGLALGREKFGEAIFFLVLVGANLYFYLAK